MGSCPSSRKVPASASAIGLIVQIMKTRQDSVTLRGYPRFATPGRGRQEPVDARDDDAYETPPEAAPSPEETEEARESMTRALPVLLGVVFVTFVVVTVIILLLR
jgi:hypothetical protein